MLWTQNKDIKSINTLMTASWHVVDKVTVSRISKVDYRNKVLPWNVLFMIVVIICGVYRL